MKTKFMMLLAAMLLSASAFAQSDNNEPLKGDVNGDGKVDVADINEIIKIMKEAGGTAGETVYKWYLGTVQPTAVDNPSTWRISNSDAGFNVTVTLPEGTSWFAYPDTWTYSAIEESSGDEFEFNAFVPAATKTSIPGYILLKMGLGAEDTIRITFSK